jgi:hypothetical protein
MVASESGKAERRFAGLFLSFAGSVPASASVASIVRTSKNKPDPARALARSATTGTIIANRCCTSRELPLPRHDMPSAGCLRRKYGH